MKRLQVLINGKWEYVFCHNAVRKKEYPVITKDKKKALKIDAFDYIRNKYSDKIFRAEPRYVKDEQ
jgi:hypothetical protein